MPLKAQIRMSLGSLLWVAVLRNAASQAHGDGRALLDADGAKYLSTGGLASINMVFNAYVRRKRGLRGKHIAYFAF